MGKEIDLTTRHLAQDLYVVDGLTYEQAAAQAGVSVQAAKEWGAKEGWREKREQYRAEINDIRANTIKLRKALLDKALNNLDPQAVYALARMEALDRRQTKTIDPSASSGPVDRPKIFLEHLDFIARTLNETDPEGLKVLANNFEPLITKYKIEHAQAAKSN